MKAIRDSGRAGREVPASREFVSGRKEVGRSVVAMDLIDESVNQDAELSLGGRLCAARERQGLPVEKAARETRVRAQRLRELEADDYSNFPHPSYARMFLMDYSKYLGIPFAEIRASLPETGQCGAGGYQYLDQLSGENGPAPVVNRIKPRRRLWPAFATLAALMLVAFIALQGVMMFRKLDSLGFGQPANGPTSAKVEGGGGAEDAAVQNSDQLPAPAPATLVVPAAVNDDRAAFFVGGTLDPNGRVR